MENLSFGGRQVAGFPLDQQAVVKDTRFFTAHCGVGEPSVNGVRVPPFLVGAGAGAIVGALAYYLQAPLWGTAVSGVGTALGVWASVR